MIKWFAFALVSGAAYLPGREVGFAAQWPLYEALRTTAAIIFGVMGAWLAIVYPRALGRLLGVRDESQGASARDVSDLLKPVQYSTAILAVILFIGPLAEIARQVEGLQQWRLQLRGVSFALLIFLTCAQLWALVLSLVGPDTAIGELSDLAQRQAIVQRAKKLVRRTRRRRDARAEHGPDRAPMSN